MGWYSFSIQADIRTTSQNLLNDQRCFDEQTDLLAEKYKRKKPDLTYCILFKDLGGEKDAYFILVCKIGVLMLAKDCMNFAR